MAPTYSITENTRKTKGGNAFIGLFKKIKISKRNRKDEKNQNQRHNLEFDAIPDPNEIQKDPEEVQSNRDSIDSDAFKQTHNPSDFGNKFNFFSTSNEEEEEHENRQNSSPKNTSQWTYSDNKPCFHQQNNIYGGSYIHIGHKTIITKNKVFNESQKHDQSKHSMKKTREISALFRCQAEIERGHMNYLSDHFGEQWGRIGKALGFSEGEVNEVKKSVEKRQSTDYDQESGYQMLMKWCQLQEEKPTVGELAETLWDTEMQNAQEAVKRLSVDIKHFQDL